MKEDLIITVQSRPALWDKRHQQHHNRHFLDKERKAVATELNSTDREVKLVWKNLRDEFRKQFNKTPRSGDAAPESTCSWKFFNSMLFLRDQFVPRRSTGNLTVLPDDENVDVNEDMELMDDLVEEHVDSPSEINGAPLITAVKRTMEEYTRTGFKKRMTTQAKIGQELVNLEKEKLKFKMNKADEKNKNDEDVGFFNSLLPHVKTLNPRKKMMFRMKVQELLFDMAYSPEHKPSYTNHPPSSAMSHRYDNHQYYPHTETSSFTYASTCTPTSLTSPDIEEEYMPTFTPI